MERSDIFKVVQNILSNTPMFLIGSGSSAAYGLPGMEELGKHLATNLDAKYRGISCWDEFLRNLGDGQDLESALSNVNLSKDLLDDIRIETWKVVSKQDLALFDRIVFEHEELPLSKLLSHFFRTHPQKLDIITTNYDRVIEYACDAANLPVNTGFNGYYSKQYIASFPTRNVINLIKIHGSIDVYRDAHGATIAIPLQRELQCGLLPEIITPGLSKFEAILTGTPRQLLSETDRIIRSANAFLCVGYGFNDSQIQENMIQKIRAGVPLVLVTKGISDGTAHLLANNAKDYITVSEGEHPDTTDFCINRKCYTIDGTYWTVNGIMEIIS